MLIIDGMDIAIICAEVVYKGGFSIFRLRHRLKILSGVIHRKPPEACSLSEPPLVRLRIPKAQEVRQM